MRTCTYCGGGIAEPGEVTGWAGKWCHCWMGRGYVAGQNPEPFKGIDYIPEETRRQMDEFNKRNFNKGNVKKPSFSHILNLCEQLSLAELRALIGVLNQMHDCESLAADPNGFKK